MQWPNNKKHGRALKGTQGGDSLATQGIRDSSTFALVLLGTIALSFKGQSRKMEREEAWREQFATLQKSGRRATGSRK